MLNEFLHVLQPLPTLPDVPRPDAGDEAGNLLLGRMPTPVEANPNALQRVGSTTASEP